MGGRSFKQACRYHLTHTFGLDAYRPGQKAAVHALLSGRDVLCVLPTGAGKSLCWQLPALVHPGLTVVVSPLIALMRDQVQHLTALGIPAASLDSLMSEAAKEKVVEDVRSGTVRIVFVAPERLEQPAFRRLCQEARLWMVVVDEAHCVVQWGEAFRPAYTAISSFMHCLPHQPVVCALTATADKQMQKAVTAALEMNRVRRILLSIHRENLVYTARTTLDRTADILRLCQNSPCRTVVFCRSRMRCEVLTDILVKHNVKAVCYHAGISREQRLLTQRSFQVGAAEVLCATTAFGMGVDIPDIRRVIHDYLPDHVIDYVQQSGRCGRDGKPAECLILVEPIEFVRKARRSKTEAKGFFLSRSFARHKTWRAQKKLMKILFTEPCIPAGIAAAFGGRGKPCGHCSACCHSEKQISIPFFPGMRPWQIRAWMLRWQRNALAKQKGVSPRSVASDETINAAARTLVFPEGVKTTEELERMLAYFRRNG